METIFFSTDFLCKIEFSQRGSARCLKIFHLDLACFCCKCMSRLLGTSRTSGDVRLESAKWAKADTDQVPVTNRDFMSTRPRTPFRGVRVPLISIRSHCRP